MKRDLNKMQLSTRNLTTSLSCIPLLCLLFERVVNYATNLKFGSLFVKVIVYKTQYLLYLK